MALAAVDNFNVGVPPTAERAAVDNFNVPGEASQVPSSPSNFTATPLNAAAHVSWTQAPGPLTGYRLTAVSGSVTRTYTIPPSATEVDITSLSTAATWSLTLFAVNGAFESPPSNTSVTPTSGSGDPSGAYPVIPPAASAPNAPVLTGVTGGDTVVQAVWTAPYNGESTIQHYIISATSSAGTLTQEISGTLTTGSIGGLTNDTAYIITVSAMNAIGRSAESNALTATPSSSGPVVEPPPPPVEEPPPTKHIEAPSFYAFLPQTPFSPGSWVGP